MPEYPKKQKYESHKLHASQTIDVSFICLRAGEFVHIDANGKAVEIKMDNEGNVGVCVSEGVVVATFAEIYGGQHYIGLLSRGE